MVRRMLILAGTVCCMFVDVHPIAATNPDDVVAKIEQMVSQGEKADRSLGEAVVAGIEENAGGVATRLLEKLKDKKLAEKQLVVYVWAAGLTKDQTLATTIMQLHRLSSSELVKGNCLRALAMIGGKQAEDHLLAMLAAHYFVPTACGSARQLLRCAAWDI